MLEKIILACEVMPLSSIFKTIYLFGFFGFFGIFNLAPSSKLEFKITNISAEAMSYFTSPSGFITPDHSKVR